MKSILLSVLFILGSVSAVVGQNATDTLTNKTLTSPAINGSTGSAKTLNNIRFADQFANLSAVVKDIGASAKGIAIIPTSYSGTDCPPSGHSNIVWWDLRGIIQSAGCWNNVTEYNVNDGVVNSMVRDYATFNSIPTHGGIVSHWMVTNLTHGTGGNTLDGAETEAVTNGTLTGTQQFMTGNESAAFVDSTGGTISIASGSFNYVEQTGTSNTAITEARGVWAKGCNGCIGPRPTRVYSVYGDDVTSQGSSRSYSGGFVGRALMLYSGAAKSTGLDFEDNTHATHPVLYETNANDINLRAIGTGNLNFVDTTPAIRARVVPGGFGIRNLFNDPGLQVFNTTATCTTAASAGATCTTAAITLPAAEPDTSYRVICTGKGLTNVPVVIQTTNSSATQFTITIASLTAAAATFTSYDCVVGHS